MTLLQWVEEAENQEIHPELAARAAEILSYIDPEAAKDAGVAAFTFFVWVGDGWNACEVLKLYLPCAWTIS